VEVLHAREPGQRALMCSWDTTAEDVEAFAAGSGRPHDQLWCRAARLNELHGFHGLHGLSQGAKDYLGKATKHDDGKERMHL